MLKQVPRGDPVSKTEGNIVIREAQRDDVADMVEIINLCYPEYPTSLEEFEHWQSSFDRERYFRKQQVACDDDGRVIAWSQLSHEAWIYVPDQYGMNIRVHPEFMRRGIGTMLWDEVMKDLVERDASLVRAFTLETYEHSLAFLDKLGFEEFERACESRLHLDGFDPGQFYSYVERFHQAGLKVSTLDQERASDPDFDRKLHELHNAACAEMPLPEPYVPQRLEVFLKQEVDNPIVISDAFLIARDGDELVAYTSLWKRTVRSSLTQSMTATRPDYRGKGIATALKVLVTEWAKKEGYAQIWTWNDEKNDPMLRINTKLGYKKQPEWIGFRKKLKPKTGRQDQNGSLGD
jgi:GNAT superfamily N-acetyltransferase